MYDIQMLNWIGEHFFKYFHYFFPFLSRFSTRFDSTRRRWNASGNGCTWWYGYYDTGAHESYAANDATTFPVINSGAFVLGPRYNDANYLPLKSNT